MTFNLAWQDSFAKFDTTNWYAVDDSDPNRISPMDAYETYMRPSNVSVANGQLAITVAREEVGGKHFSGGMVSTQNKRHFLYGRFEIAARLPKSQGFWSSLWLYPAAPLFGKWPLSGEIDIVEQLGREPNNIHSNLHYGNPDPNTSTVYTVPAGSADFATDFHLFAFDWLPDVMRWYIDGVQVKEARSWWTTGGVYPAPFNAPHYLMMNVWLGGSWAGATDTTTVVPNQMLVDYVKYYSL